MRLVMGALPITLLLAVNAQSKPVSAKLNQVKKEILETRRQIIKYETIENTLNKDAASLQHQNIQSRQEEKRLKRILKQVKNREKNLAFQLASLEEDSNFWSSALQSDFRSYFALLKIDASSMQTNSLWQEEFLRFSLLNEASMMRALGGSAQKTAQKEKAAHESNSKLLAQSREALALSERSFLSYQEKRSLIMDLDRKKMAAQEKEKRLKETAAALTRLLKKLSRPRQHRGKRRLQPEIAMRPYSLSWPVSGKLLSVFGRQKNRELDTWVIHQGIVIETLESSPVKSAASGRVIFAGPFRSYGRIVIVDHGRNFFSIYGRLGTIFKKSGENVKRGDILGLSSAAPQGQASSIYFELRQGTRALNPVQWLKRQP